MVVLEKQRPGLERILSANIEEIRIDSIKKFLSEVFPLFMEAIEEGGIGSIRKIAEGFESKHGMGGLAKILVKKGLEYFKHKTRLEPEYVNLRKFYDIGRVEGITFLNRLFQKNPYSYGGMRYPDGTRVVDDYENYQSALWVHKWI